MLDGRPSGPPASMPAGAFPVLDFWPKLRSLWVVHVIHVMRDHLDMAGLINVGRVLDELGRALWKRNTAEIPWEVLGE